MARRRRQQPSPPEEEDDDPAPAPSGGGKVIAVAGVFLAIGFVSGYFVGVDGAKAPAAAPPANAPFASGAAPFAGGAAGPFAGGGSSTGGMPAGGLAPAVLPPPHKGHTFTGDVEVPPHTEAAHQLADVLLKDVTCPCGGCQKMTLGTCTCDTSKEIAGFAAHLLERGKHGDDVLSSLAPRYGLALSPEVLSRARAIVLENPQFAEAAGALGDMPAGMPEAAMPASEQPAAPAAHPGSAALDGLEGLSEMGHADPGVQRLVDVPTSARPGSGSALAATVLDPSGFAGGVAESYAIAKKIPEVLAGILCGCGCSTTLGHQSLLTCYQSAHASTCPICQKEAHEAAALAAQGLSVTQIRTRLHAEYGLPGA